MESSLLVFQNPHIQSRIVDPQQLKNFFRLLLRGIAAVHQDEHSLSDLEHIQVFGHIEFCPQPPILILPIILPSCLGI